MPKKTATTKPTGGTYTITLRDRESREWESAPLPHDAGVTDQLRAIIRTALNSGLTQSQIAREAGVPQQTISEFLRGASLYGPNIDKLARRFGFMLRPRE